jgi:hypothetical protein
MHRGFALIRPAFLRPFEPGEKRLIDRMLPEASELSTLEATGIAETQFLGLDQDVRRPVGAFVPDRLALPLWKVGPSAGIEIDDQ